MEKKKKEASFSVALGLFDYINPIFYTVTSLTIIKNMKGVMDTPLYVIYIIGALLSLVFGFTIPTVKFLVGMGKMKFEMPVNLVCFVNTGIFISGLMFSKYVMNINTGVFIAIIIAAGILLTAIYMKHKKFNTVAVLIGGVGYLLLYISLITLSSRNQIIFPIVLYAIAICLFVLLILIGCKSDLMNPKVHWAIEISNVLCQGSVALGTVLLFSAM